MLEAYVEDVTGRFNLNSLVDGERQGRPERAATTSSTSWRALEIEPKWASHDRGLDRPRRPARSRMAPKTAPTLRRIRPTARQTRSSPAPRSCSPCPASGATATCKLAPYVTALPPRCDDQCLQRRRAAARFADRRQRTANSASTRRASRRARESGCFPTLEDIHGVVRRRHGRGWQTKVKHRVSQTSNYFRLTSIVTIGSADFALYSLLQRDETGQAHVLMRSFTPD